VVHPPQNRGWIFRVHSRASFTALTALLAPMCLIATMPLAQAQTFRAVYSFQGKTDGRNPQVGLFTNAIYGTTFLGGDPTCACGTIYKLLPAGTIKTLHTFVGTDGANPTAGLVEDKNGNLFGTTSQGGIGNSSAGTVFKLAPPATVGAAWTETVLHTFTGGADGAHPYAGVIFDGAGNLYGTTNGGGAFNYGTVFELDSTGNETVLYSFTGLLDGASPYAGVVRDGAGNLYGTTGEGGAFSHGTVYRLDSSGVETVLHSFNGGTDGAYPSAGLTLDAAGNLYGTANEGGAAGNAGDNGTIFELNSTGSFTVLHTFTGGVGGANPAAGMILNSAGKLCGVTTEGGDRDDDGTVFELDPTTGTFTLLHTFTAGNGGAYPYTALILDSVGNLYGATVDGGTSKRGIVFEITP
jgi:uncharacterized repeat protein (TIGR03803 family)